jgi:biopolymer transport protein ExbD
MTPMVDVTFLLLIFFMVTAAFSMQKSIAMPRQPVDAPGQPSEPPPIAEVRLQIDAYGSFLLLTPDWEAETPSKQRLVQTLKRAAAEAGQEELRLEIEVHELAKLRSLVDALDAGTLAGYRDLKVNQVEDFR